MKRRKANSERLHITLPGLLSLALLAALFFKLSKDKTHRIKMTIINDTGKNLYLQLIEAGFNFIQAQYITAQAAHETDNFQSDIFQKNNNCFGMKLARVRQTTAIGERKGHAIYASLKDCIEDYKIYYQVRKFNTVYSNLGAFIKALKEKAYFEADEETYLKGCTFFYNLYFNGKTD